MNFNSKFEMSCLFPNCENTKHFCQNTVIKFFKFPTQTYIGLCSNSQEFVACSEFFQLVNDWFDVFNVKTTQKDTRPLSKAYGLSLSEQNRVLQEMSDVVEHLFPSRKTLLPFQRGIMQNNNALPLLLKQVQDHYGMHFILTSKLNQDCLENFFSAIRAKGGLHDHSSPLEFK